MSKQQASDIMGVSSRTLDRLVKAQLLRVVRVGRRVLVPTAEVLAFIDRQLGRA